ncbi:hypothetical protein M513_00982 [Trichuris suis]|uniref:GPI ethanolamine phosphate transferase 1 n=1 Tax=Trichuris suis TaxID=68888 RepID=A0A085MLX3_9BILA|nr:hypothetical protein M513_00982 [Trichuris suis]
MVSWTGALLGLVVHLILLYAVFDVYYSSPLVHGMRSHGANAAPPADRLVLFVVDGLRAQSFFECDANGTVKSPFLRQMSRKGSWGISKTRVPTETRPGHVAIISGFPEDVSAVMRGWRENPVEFDSFFNQSRYTWSWGSSSTISIFSKGHSKAHIFTHSYPVEMEEFYREAYQLDDWVFRKFKMFLNLTLTNGTLNNMVHQNKIAFFLHLLGMDMLGHSSKPYTETYDKGIRMVDRGIEELYYVIEDYFGDERTAYVLTADHGMTDWGSHGAGSTQETNAPLITWGSGINRMLDTTSSACWPTSSLDVDQVDIAPLMSALIGAAFPANSVGVLPLEYLNISSRNKALLMLANFKQLLEQMLVQMERKREMYWSIFFREFPDMTAQKIRTLSDTLDSFLSKKRYAAMADISITYVPAAVSSQESIPAWVRFLCWVLLVLSFVFPFLVSTLVIDKLTVIAFSLLLPFTLMSVSYEPSFFVIYTMHMYVWIAIEVKLPPSFILKLDFCREGVTGSKKAVVRVDDVRRALFFIFFLFLGFFGTGNIASVNSFDPNFIILFVGIFSPFLMLCLLMIKIAIPFVIACCCLCTLAIFTNSRMDTLYWLVVIVGDFQAAQFLLLLKDTGSWLEIGESISHYFIAMTMVAVVMLTSYCVRFCTENQVLRSKHHLP